MEDLQRVISAADRGRYIITDKSDVSCIVFTGKQISADRRTDEPSGYKGKRKYQRVSEEEERIYPGFSRQRFSGSVCGSYSCNQ